MQKQCYQNENLKNLTIPIHNNSWKNVQWNVYSNIATRISFFLMCCFFLSIFKYYCVSSLDYTKFYSMNIFLQKFTTLGFARHVYSASDENRVKKTVWKVGDDVEDDQEFPSQIILWKWRNKLIWFISYSGKIWDLKFY
jgi:hypothetical protein